MNWLPLLFSGIKEFLEYRKEVKKVKRETKLKKLKAEAELQVAKIQNEANWETASVGQSGWKDEWFTLLFSIPLILCFIPSMQKYVTSGFAALEQTPDWYLYTLMALVGSSVGIRKLANFKAK